MEDAFKKLDKLTHEEARMAVAQNLKATHDVDQRVREVGDTVVAVGDEVDDRVAVVHNSVACVDDKVTGVDDAVKMVGDKVAEAIHGTHNYLRSITDAIFNPGTTQMVGRQRLLCNKLLTT